MSVDGGVRSDFDRRRVSVRWLSGTILTGLCGAALMGGAVFAALDGEAHFAANPEHVEPGMRGPLANRATARKTDRLPPVGEINAARQVIRTTVMAHIGEREVPHVTPFVRVSSNLALSITELSADIPQFNPQRALANMDDDTVAEERPEAAPDAEVSFVTRDLSSVMPRVAARGPGARSKRGHEPGARCRQLDRLSAASLQLAERRQWRHAQLCIAGCADRSLWRI